MKKKEQKNILKRSLCVYVNNTKKLSTLEKDKKKKKQKFVAKKSICPDAMGHSSRWLQKNLSPQPSVLVGLPFKLGVSLTEINVVFSALSIYLSSGCIDWKLNNEIVQNKKKKIKKWLVKKIIQLPLISCKRKLFLSLNERSAFYFLT